MGGWSRRVAMAVTASAVVVTGTAVRGTAVRETAVRETAVRETAVRETAVRKVAVNAVAASAVVAGGAGFEGLSAQSADKDKSASEKTIIANESKINDAVTKGDVGAFKALVASDAWSIDMGGPMSAADFQKNFKQIKIDPGWKITNTKVIWVASNTAVLYYKWTGSGTFMGQPIPPVVWASTVWHKSGDKWSAVFHQESAAAK